MLWDCSRKVQISRFQFNTIVCHRLKQHHVEMVGQLVFSLNFWAASGIFGLPTLRFSNRPTWGAQTVVGRCLCRFDCVYVGGEGEGLMIA